MRVRSRVRPSPRGIGEGGNVVAAGVAADDVDGAEGGDAVDAGFPEFFKPEAEILSDWDVVQYEFGAQPDASWIFDLGGKRHPRELNTDAQPSLAPGRPTPHRSKKSRDPSGFFRRRLNVHQGRNEIPQDLGGNHDRVTVSTHILSDLHHPAALVLLQVEEEHLPVRKYLLRMQ